MEQAILVKVKWNKGQMEGRPYDYTRVSFLTPIYEGSDGEFGFDINECEFGKADDHVKLLSYRGKLPALVNVKMEDVMKKGNKAKFVTRIELVQEKVKINTNG